MASDSTNPVSKSNLYGGDNYMLSDSGGLYDIGTGDRAFFLPDSSGTKVMLLKFPFHFGDTAADDGTYLSASPGSQSTYDHSTSVIADGTGTLITPCRTYSNALRLMRAYRHIYSHDGKISDKSTYVTVHSFEWYAPGVHAPVLSISTQTVYNYWQKKDEHTQWSVLYNDVTKTPLGLKDNSVSGSGWFSFQSPARGDLRIWLNDDSEGPLYLVQIIDLTGKTILQQNFHPKSPQLNISGISAGVYVVQINAPGGLSGRKKLIVE